MPYCSASAGAACSSIRSTPSASTRIGPSSPTICRALRPVTASGRACGDGGQHLGQRLLEDVEQLVELGRRDRQRRREHGHPVARAEEEAPAAGGLPHLDADVLGRRERLLGVAVGHELEPDEEALPADVADAREAARQRTQPFERLLAAGGRIRHEVAVAKLLERRQAGRARDRIARVGVAGRELQARGAPERLRDPLGEHRRGERDVAAGEALPEDEDVGPGREVLRGEELPDTAEAGDDLVEDEHDVVPVAELPERRQVAVGRDDDAGRHQDRLGDEGRDRLRPFQLDHLLDEPDVRGAEVGRRGVERRPVRVGRVQVDEAGRERLVRALVRAPAARRERLAGDAVVGAVVREHLELARVARLAVELARHLDRRLDRLRAAAAPLERRVPVGQQREELARELEAAVARRHGRRGESETRELCRRRLDHPGVAVPEAEAEGAREPVDVPAAVDVADPDPVALGQDQRVVAERLHLGEVDHHPGDVLVHRLDPRTGTRQSGTAAAA